MQLLGYLFISASFLAGSFLAVRTESDLVDWRWFIPSLLVGVVGVALAQAAVRKAARHDDRTSTDLEALTGSMSRIVDNIRLLDDEAKGLHPYDVHPRIDELFIDDLVTFVEARESIGHVYGLQAYAEVMNEFAAGERYLNRVWSASVDCYVDEVREYLGRARTQFESTATKLAALTDG